VSHDGPPTLATFGLIAGPDRGCVVRGTILPAGDWSRRRTLPRAVVRPDPDVPSGDAYLAAVLRAYADALDPHVEIV
jgi:hypothetical protein